MIALNSRVRKGEVEGNADNGGPECIFKKSINDIWTIFHWNVRKNLHSYTISK